MNSDSGIYLLASSKNNLTSNYISSNGRDGIYLISSANNDISNNEIYSNNLRGIFIDSSSYNIITENNISSNNMDGIHYWKSSNNNITSNDISNNDNGIFLRYLSDSNLIISNNISNNQCGINLSLSSNNRIYHNNIITNTYQALDDQNDNFWDNGYPSGGNYWSDYGGVDNFKGPNQNIPGKDGIGDNPYDIDSDSRDNYPLLEPWKYYMILKQGWNLISLPLIQEERNLTKVLGSIDGWYDAVQWFNPKDIDDPWKHHKINKPYGNDLFEITEKMGFWIHITRPGDTIFIYNGTLPIQNLSISLTQGWNHVGYPSFTKHNRTEGLNNLTFYNEVDSIWTYSAATQKWKQLGPLDFFEPCKGYWIHAKTKCEWEVPL